MKPGTRLRGLSGAEIIVIRAEGDIAEITCGGAPMAQLGDDTPTGDGTDGTETVVLGKRYVDSSGRIELLCTKPGPGPLAVAGETLIVKDAKPLPSSD